MAASARCTSNRTSQTAPKYVSIGRLANDQHIAARFEPNQGRRRRRGTAILLLKAKSMSELLKNTTIMVIDDDSDTCELLRTALEQAGASVLVAHNVDGAIETFRRCPPHAVVADIRLGNSDGYALIKAIREHNIEHRGFTPAVAVTGFASPEDKERAIAAGFNAYLAKPFEPAAVISAIAKILSGRMDLAL